MSVSVSLTLIFEFTHDWIYEKGVTENWVPLHQMSDTLWFHDS